MKQITVVMSVYNEPLEWLQHSIDSILAQTFEAFEFIIINDNPQRRENKDILKSYSNKDGRISIIENNENLGLAESLNKGIRQAQGKYIARMDADDISLPERFELQHRFLEKHKDVFMVGTSAQIMDGNGLLREKTIMHSSHKQIVDNILAGRMAFYHSTIMLRNEGFLYRDKLNNAEDYDFYLNLLLKGKRFGNIKEVCLNYRMSGQGISMTKKRRQVIMSKLALKFYYEKLQNGYDSYDKLDFNNEEQLVKFIGIPLDKLEAEAFREKMVFALGIGDYEAAGQAFQCYKKYNAPKTEKLILWLFLTFPWLYGLYRKLRYEIFKL
ncbi:MAG: glycosyltransferase [Sedimentisphaerales bacterium]|jgi:glycosyltransferase involved in cell wall biosynthesis